MNDQTGHSILDELPLILAGPVLQHTEPTSVTVWIALKQACQVELKIYNTLSDGAVLGHAVMDGQRSTVALGKFLHIVAVTARSAIGQPLSSDRVYAYDLQFINQVNQTRQPLQQALCSSRFATVNISYFAHQKPTFVLPPAQLQDLRIIQGSCRKPHGDGFDALPIVDCLIEAAANQPHDRPHQLFLTGDQIYGDDVADPLLWVASQLGDALLGWEEQLPIGQREPGGFRTPKDLPQGQRAEVATHKAGFTAGLRNKRAKVNSHLMSLGEYYASYLLAWSPIGWLTPFPKGRTMTRDRKARRHWDREVRDMQQFIHTLWKVRRALANIPTYTIFDDHDVSDDWNLNQAWCLRVLGRPLGRRVVQNALLAYAVFQAWGNTPWQFEAGQPGEKLLAAAQSWSASRGTDTAVEEAIARYVGLPPSDHLTGLPTFSQQGSVLVLDRAPEALTWHYTVKSHCHEVIVLDTRTWRGYPLDQKLIAPPMLLCPSAFEQQLSQPLKQTAQATKAGESQIQATFIVAPTNLFGLKVIDWIHHWQLRHNKVFSTDVGDAWNIHTEALARFLSTLFEQRQHIVVLSGDIHYGSTVRLSHAYTTTPHQSRSVLVQLTASALKNEEALTHIIHTRLKDWLLPEKPRYWLGWSNPPDMVELSGKQRDSTIAKQLAQENHSHPPIPDWKCALEWIPRQSVQKSLIGQELAWLLTAQQQAKNHQWRWLKPLLGWKSRWFQDGREVVGLNNVAIVQFKWGDTTDAHTIIQDLHWFSSWHPIQIVYSRYEAKLESNQALLESIPTKGDRG
ncbi:PhoD-like phosphatase [Kovacikia minuta CCNUW1]|uniref:PhoD-like phosphatase n=1 Tax=Kovacikia minuta TaxID=2931930 RepID=UPI001CD0356D|nr:PhoD-like phosphatase [Kovacikia minuta]UBF28644.1 PhoD-like phosphatase [Kovacikia minuta CCNUW1]